MIDGHTLLFLIFEYFEADAGTVVALGSNPFAQVRSTLVHRYFLFNCEGMGKKMIEIDRQLSYTK